MMHSVKKLLLLNSRPRKCLNWDNPFIYFKRCVALGLTIHQKKKEIGFLCPISFCISSYFICVIKILSTRELLSILIISKRYLSQMRTSATFGM